MMPIFNMKEFLPSETLNRAAQVESKEDIDRFIQKWRDCYGYELIEYLEKYKKVNDRLIKIHLQPRKRSGKDNIAIFMDKYKKFYGRCNY